MIDGFELSVVPGVSQRSLCEQFGWEYRDVAKTAKYLGMATHDYLQAKTGWWLYLERYYPPEVGLQILRRAMLIRQLDYQY